MFQFSRAAFVVVIVAVAATAFAARPVAHWDVVPDQIVAQPFEVGVVAFHIDGVKVEFRIDDERVHTADEPTLNPRTNVWEYVYRFDPAKHADGPVTIDARAIALNDKDETYGLRPLTLHANAGGSLTVDATTWVDAANGSDDDAGTKDAPFKTLAKAMQNTPAGGTIYLMPGTYESNGLRGGSGRDYWTTITAAPQVERDQVRITPGRPGTQRLKWTDLTLWTDHEGGYHPILSGEQGKHSVWLDDVTVTNTKGRWAATTIAFGNRYVAYVTGGESVDIANGPGARLIRDHHLRTITSDAWTGGGRLVVNCSAIDINPGDTGAHPDFHQSYSRAPDWTEDVILYNVRGYDCVSQGLFGSRLRNAAFVNVLFDRGETVMYSQYSGPMENVMFLHVTLGQQSWLWRGQGDGAFSPSEVYMVNSIIPSMQAIHDAKTDGLTIDHCHFVNDQRAMGTNQTTGEPGHVDPAGNDFRMTQASPAWGTGRMLKGVPTDINGNAYDPDARNRGAYAKSADKP